MPEQALTVLKVCLLILIYLFFLRVLRAVWAEVSAIRSVPSGLSGRPAGGRTRPAVVADSGGAATVPPPAAAGPSSTLTVRLPPEMAGQRIAVSHTVSVGRDPASTVVVNDGYISNHHARFQLGANGIIVEDVGSTNGTHVNDGRIEAPTLLTPGDVVRCGNLVLDVT